MESQFVGYVALIGLAFGLGLKHGMDPDHLSVVDGVARLNAGTRPWVARWAGALFSLGHGAMMAVLACAAASFATRWDTPPWLEWTGAAISTALLLHLAWLNLGFAVSPVQPGETRPTGVRARLTPNLGHPLAVFVVGVLFAASFDVVAQAALFAVTARPFGGVVATLGLAAAFTAGMLATDSLNSLWMARLIRQADRRAVLASRIMAGATGAISLTVAGLTLMNVAAPDTMRWAEGIRLWLGVAVVLTMLAAFAACLAVTRDTSAPPRSA